MNACRIFFLTFEVEEDVGLVILEHLGDKLHIHVLDVDFLGRYE